MAFDDLRQFGTYLKEQGELLTIDKEVDKDVEVPGIMRKWAFEDRPAILFNNVRGYESAIMSNIIGSRRRLAMALGIDQEHLTDEYLNRRDDLLPVGIKDDGPVMETIVTEDINVGRILPAPVHHEKDVNPYITSGVLFLKDPESNRQSIGIHRAQLIGPDQLTVAIKNPPSSLYLAKAEAAGMPLDVAIVVGLDPVTWFSSVIWAPGGHDKLEMAGGLRGKAIELVPCTTVDLKVPATAEAVMEGRITPGSRGKDGPFGEVSGYYKSFADSPVVQVSAVMHKKEFIFQDLMPWSRESDMLLEFSYGVEAYKELKRMVPSVTGFHFLEGTCMLNAAISLSKKSEGEVKRILYLALNLNPNIKNIIVVDDDVDIFNITDLSWALATRYQPDKDTVILSDVKGAFIDPSANENTVTAKIGIDATKPTGAGNRKYDRVRVTLEVQERAEKLLAKCGG